jgi:hypothetical protein
MDSGYRDVRYTSRVVDGVCKDDRQSRHRGIKGGVVERGRTCNQEVVSVGELFNQAAKHERCV